LMSRRAGRFTKTHVRIFRAGLFQDSPQGSQERVRPSLRNRAGVMPPPHFL
jgi:hypothetical protein